MILRDTPGDLETFILTHNIWSYLRPKDGTIQKVKGLYGESILNILLSLGAEGCICEFLYHQLRHVSSRKRSKVTSIHFLRENVCGLHRQRLSPLTHRVVLHPNMKWNAADDAFARQAQWNIGCAVSRVKNEQRQGLKWVATVILFEGFRRLWWSVMFPLSVCFLSPQRLRHTAFICCVWLLLQLHLKLNRFKQLAFPCFGLIEVFSLHETASIYLS